MKPLLLTLLFAGICGISVFAQDTIYYSMTWRETTAANASYFRTKIKTADGWQVADHFLTGKPQMTGGYADDSFHVRQGEFAWYDSSGKPTHICTYSHDKLNGMETYYHANGGRRITGVNKDDKFEGEWTGYYPSGKISARATFKDGKQVSGTFFHEDGSRDKTITDFMKDSEFPGGVAQWLRFLNKNLRYPDSAVVHEYQGTVVVGFMVSMDGKVYNIKVIEPVNPYLDAEAARVIGQMGDWQPAIFGGMICESYKKQPIIFKLNAE